jgi:hypothetical protein
MSPAEAVAVADPATGETPPLASLATAAAEATSDPKDTVTVGLCAEAVAPATPATGVTAGVGWFAVAVAAADPAVKVTDAPVLLAEAVALAVLAAGETAALALLATAVADADSASAIFCRGSVRRMMIGWIGWPRPSLAMRDPSG